MALYSDRLRLIHDDVYGHNIAEAQCVLDLTSLVDPLCLGHRVPKNDIVSAQGTAHLRTTSCRHHRRHVQCACIELLVPFLAASTRAFHWCLAHAQHVFVRMSLCMSLCMSPCMSIRMSIHMSMHMSMQNELSRCVPLLTRSGLGRPLRLGYPHT